MLAIGSIFSVSSIVISGIHRAQLRWAHRIPSLQKTTHKQCWHETVISTNMIHVTRAQIVDFFRIAISWQSPRRYRDIVTIEASAHGASSVLSHVSQHEMSGWLGWPHRHTTQPCVLASWPWQWSRCYYPFPITPPLPCLTLYHTPA